MAWARLFAVTPVGTLIYQVTANDVDSAPPLEYMLLSQNSDEFHVERFSGRVILAKPIDAEKTPIIELKIQVS
jgi:hypothetical protein